MINESQLIPYFASPIPNDKNILVLAPHPDDEVFGCGGSLALHLQKGSNVIVVLVTSGEVGGNSDIRFQESLNASKTLGSYEIVRWSYPDRGVPYSNELINKIIQLINDRQITLVYAPSLWENHPDHRNVSLNAIEAVRRSPHCSLMQFEVGAPLRPNRLVDITSVLHLKSAAMECFPSQLEQQKYNEHILALNQFRSYTLSNEVKVAEAFEYYSSAELKENSLLFFQSEYERQRDKNITDIFKEHDTVSIVIRNQNRDTLSKTLESVASQTYPFIEVILLNTSEEAHHFTESSCGKFPVIFIESNQKSNLSAVSDRGLSNSNGKYALFIDDGDWIGPTHIETLIHALEKAPNAILAYSDGIIADEYDREISLITTHHPREYIYVKNFMPTHTVMFHTRAYKLLGCRFDPNLAALEDWDFWMQLAQHGKFIHVDSQSAFSLKKLSENLAINKEVQQSLLEKWHTLWSSDVTSFIIKEVLKGEQNQILQHDNEALNQQILKLQGENENLLSLLHQIQNSKSWKLTKILRDVKKFFSLR